MDACNILMVDCAPEDYLHILQAFLELGTEKIVHYAHDPHEAWIMLEEQHSVYNHVPDMIVTDLPLPVEKGALLLCRLREDARFRNIRVMIYTPRISDSDRQYCERYPPVGFQPKAGTFDSVLSAAETMLRSC